MSKLSRSIARAYPTHHQSPKHEPPKKPTLAREVAEELRGENDTCSDEVVMDAIKKKAQARMDEFDARLFGKRKAA